MGSAVKFKQTHVPRQTGEAARLKVAQGPDMGTIFVIKGGRATIGRGEENDIVLFDLKSSRRHAEVVLSGAGWVVKDAGSANGLLLNGKQTKFGDLKTGDTISLGETILEFVASEMPTQILMAPPKSSSEIRAEQMALEAQRRNIRRMSSFGGLGQMSTGAPPSEGSPFRTLLLLGVAGGGAYFLLHGDLGSLSSKPRFHVQGGSSSNSATEIRDLASFLPPTPEGETNRTAEMLFRSGFREYREQNYLRARMQFETVLQIAPNHPLAKLYFEKCVKAIDDEVSFHLEHGKKSFAAGKLKEAQGHFEAVMRLMARDQASAGYLEAKEQLGQVQKSMGEHSGGSS